MSLYFWIGTGALAAGLLFMAVLALVLLLRVLAVTRRARKLSEHPSVVALRRAPDITATFHNLQVPISEIRGRSKRIAEDIAALGASAALLEIDVDRISFATRLLLETFFPTLRGSMAD